MFVFEVIEKVWRGVWASKGVCDGRRGRDAHAHTHVHRHRHTLSHTYTHILMLIHIHSPVCRDAGPRWAPPPLGIAASASAVLFSLPLFPPPAPPHPPLTVTDRGWEKDIELN